MLTIDIEQLTSIRKYLHAHPEVSEKEYNTANYLESFLKEKTSADKVHRFGETGVLALFDSAKPGKTILFRADTDALPIQEINSFEHKSTVDGVSHKCGHDGHTTILLGVALHFSSQPLNTGKVILLFQPAEENGMGAKSALRDAYFQSFDIDYVFALHNLPGFKKGHLVFKRGVFTPNVTSIIIKLKGKTAHAAEPEHGYNPSIAISKLHLEAKKFVNNNPSSNDFLLFTAIYTHIGEIAHGISAGEGEVHFTIRSWDKTLLSNACQKFEHMANDIANEENLDCSISYTQEFDANINQNDAVDILENAAKHANLDYSFLDTPFKWGEDFGVITQKFRGAMFGIGSGENCPALHNPDYDFPDEIMHNAVKTFISILDTDQKK